MPKSFDLRLTRHGTIVLLLSMLTGFVIGSFHNRNFGNAAHLTGLIGGYGLIALGLLWPKLNLQPAWSTAGSWTTVISMYLNWLGLVFQGGFGSYPQAGLSTNSNSLLLWDRAGGAVLAMAVILSLFSVAILLNGLRPSQPEPNAQTE